jgi:uncharacterized protein (DUF2147 family)
MRALLLTVLMLLPVAASAQQGAAGRWQTIDDATGKPKSVVEIRQDRDGRLTGRVVEILDLKDGPDPACTRCTGANRGKPIKGLGILWGLQPDGAGKWSGGRVLDPENGKDYRAKLELLDGGRKLGVSGCIAFLCRQQVWLRR